VLDKAETWLKQTLNYAFRDRRLLEQALTHRSASSTNNERLEFLGDAVLDLVISDVVLRAHPRAAEGDLSRLRSSFVKDTSLAELAAGLGIGKHIYLGSGERKTGGHRRESILADALEAVFGAVYLDGGFDAARAVIERAFGDRLQNFPDIEDLRDPKTQLQEWLQAGQHGLPDYELLDARGEPHRRQFEARCRIESLGKETTGTGASRRAAEQQAALEMLNVILDGDEGPT
jgi:ribonuclease-3